MLSLPEDTETTRRLVTGALRKVDGVWTRTVQVFVTRMAHVDRVCPIARSSYVYYDDVVYDAALTERSTGVTYVTQLLCYPEGHVFYIYIRWNETNYMLRPHKTIEAAKEDFEIAFLKWFGVKWTEREITVASRMVLAVSDRWDYELKTYESFEEIEEVEETLNDQEAAAIIAQLQAVIVDSSCVSTATTYTTTATIER
ncbi:hypothetical protein BGX26_006627 [Mortierella sp. AD094]|nr:hypothetical protein BGX26_006627 [Mortierella sp. AD094]